MYRIRSCEQWVLGRDSCDHPATTVTYTSVSPSGPPQSLDLRALSSGEKSTARRRFRIIIGIGDAPRTHTGATGFLCPRRRFSIRMEWNVRFRLESEYIIHILYYVPSICTPYYTHHVVYLYIYILYI